MERAERKATDHLIGLSPANVNADEPGERQRQNADVQFRGAAKIIATRSAAKDTQAGASVSVENTAQYIRPRSDCIQDRA